jgi:hypothetical protein
VTIWIAFLNFIDPCTLCKNSEKRKVSRPASSVQNLTAQNNTAGGTSSILKNSKWGVEIETTNGSFATSKFYTRPNPDEMLKYEKIPNSSQRSQLVVGAWLVITIVWHASGTASAVHLAGNWVGNVAELLLLLLKVLGGGGGGVLLNPVLGLLDGFLELRWELACYLAVWQCVQLTVSLSSSSILPPRPSLSASWFFRL